LLGCGRGCRLGRPFAVQCFLSAAGQLVQLIKVLLVLLLDPLLVGIGWWLVLLLLTVATRQWQQDNEHGHDPNCVLLHALFSVKCWVEWCGSRRQARANPG